MNAKKLTMFALLGVSVLSLGSCNKDKRSWHYEDYEFLDEAAVLPAVATSGTAENFVSSSYEDREEILGKLESYAMKKNLTGITLYDDGGYVKYSDRVKFPTNPLKNADGTDKVVAGTTQYDYVTGYGFGIVSEGKLEGELSGLAADDPYKSYYHTYETDDPKTLNYMNDKGSVVGNYHGYISGSYFSTKLSSTKDSYEWFPSLATEANLYKGEYRPIPLFGEGEEESSLSSKYRIYVKVGEDAVYNIATSKASLTKYKGRQVALEDYLTPFKQLYCQANGLARGAETLTGAGSIKGISEYYNATSGGFDEASWSNVGIKTGTDDKGSYLDFELNIPCTPFYAMYYLSSSLYAPIPAEFLEDIGGIKNWQSFNEDATLSPIDTTLSTGPFVVEHWEDDKAFVFKKNELISPSILGGEGLYQIDGVHVKILSGAKNDTLLPFKEWQAGKLDGVGIPKDKIKEEVGTKGTQQTRGSSTTKLNVNSCTAEEWEKLFGENGSITKTPKSQYWNVKPAMSNDDFLLGLNLALNRTEYAQNHGVTPSINYFSDAYLSNPEKGISYNSTQAHKDALLGMYKSQEIIDNYGYDFDEAIKAFSRAATALLADGSYSVGDTIEIEICWQVEAQIQNNGAEIEKYFEDAFNNSAVCGNKLKLDVKNVAVPVWSDVYYKKMMVGQFDIGFGGISGNTLNPLNFMEVLKSDNSSGFTLNWGTDTNNPEDTIEYNGKQFTFDALFQAADTGTVVTPEGENARTYSAVLTQNTRNSDGTRTVKIKYGASNIAGVVKTSLDKVVLCWYEGEEYEEVAIEYTAEDGVITIIIPQELSEHYQGEISFDIYFSQTVGGASSSPLISLESEFPRFE